MRLIEKELAVLARWIISRFRPFIIGVTGSVGKTTTKYFVSELLLSAKQDVRAASGNLNTETGLPLAVLGYQKAPKSAMDWILVLIFAPIKAAFTFSYPKYLVLEYAADKPNDIDYLVSIAQPDISIITSIGVAHLEKFQTTKEIANEKWKLALAAKEATVTNKNVSEKVRDLNEPKHDLYILPSMKTAKAENVKFFTNRSEFDFWLANTKKQTMFSYLGNHNIDDLELAAFAAHLATGETDLIIKAIKNLTPREGRGQRLIGRNEIVVVDESYNANPDSMKAALEVLSSFKDGRRVAIIGEMKEIGPISREAHREIAELANKNADFTVGVGEPYKELKLDRWYPSVSELKEEIMGLLKPNDIVLVKGSRSNNLNEIVEMLK